MVTFYPKRIDLWNSIFDFSTQKNSNKNWYVTEIKKEFKNENEFYEFIKNHIDEINKGRFGRKTTLDYNLISTGKDIDNHLVDTLLYNNNCIGWINWDKEETKIPPWKETYIKMQPEPSITVEQFNKKEFGNNSIEELKPESIFELDVDEILSGIGSLLKEKNKKYGDAALTPLRVFSKATPIEQLKVRIDDKLSRISNMGTDVMIDEDTVTDLIGYLVLLKIAIKRQTTLRE